MEIRAIVDDTGARVRGRPHLGKLRTLGILTCLPLALWACDGGPTVGPDAGSFDDHTVSSLDRASFSALSEASGIRSALKFIIPEFQAAATRDVRFMDAGFYTLHDEWYWFRLMNGATIPGDSITPYPGRFSTIASIYDWAKTESTLPLDLRFVGDGRLYSPRFYQLGLSTPRQLGLGGLIHVEARIEPEARPEVWAFQLEFGDRITHPELVTFFELLESRLPKEIADQLVFATRARWQEELAEQMRREGLAYHDRTIRYSDLSIPGEVEVYNPGLTAGRVRFIGGGENLESSGAADLLVLDVIPDYLPPAAGLITSVPQTPLAHVNVLARNRGIPNVYLGGAFEDLELEQLAYFRAPAIIEAVAPNALRIVGLEESEYSTWLGLETKPFAIIPPIDLTDAPELIDLSLHGLAEMEALRPLIGGKNAGFLALLDTSAVRAPYQPMALTIRPYVEHIVPMARALRFMLDLPEFKAQSRVRFLFLEGQTRYDARFTTEDDRRLRDSVLTGHPPSSEIGALLAAGGVAAAIEARPWRESTKASVTQALATHFAALSSRQGLRFRSSSTVEDIEGFNGAGLYDSNTGFFFPEMQTDPKEQTRSIEWAVKKTWASYWRFEAFEERRLENIDHLSGSMAVVVHPRFDDDKELANAVVTISKLPLGVADEFVLQVNVQAGAESVANPTPGILPEVDRVRQAAGGGELVIERLAFSTLVPAGTQVLSDAELTTIFGDTKLVLEAWIAEKNRSLPVPHQVSTLTLDLELKKVAAGWPSFLSGQINPEGLVVKQARPLEPGLRTVPPVVVAQAFPRDLLARAQRVVRRSCAIDDHELEVWTAITDPLADPDFGFSETPFVAGVSLSGPELSLFVHHRDFTVASVTPDKSELPFQLELSGAGALRSFSFVDGESLVVETSSATFSRAGGACTRNVEFATPADYLRGLLDARGR